MGLIHPIFSRRAFRMGCSACHRTPAGSLHTCRPLHQRKHAGPADFPACGARRRHVQPRRRPTNAGSGSHRAWRATGSALRSAPPHELMAPSARCSCRHPPRWRWPGGSRWSCARRRSSRRRCPAAPLSACLPPPVSGRWRREGARPVPCTSPGGMEWNCCMLGIAAQGCRAPAQQRAALPCAAWRPPPPTSAPGSLTCSAGPDRGRGRGCGRRQERLPRQRRRLRP